MSGIIAPAIVNYDWTVRTNDPSYLNVSFPFRVKIEKIWFTTQQIYNSTAGLWEMGDGSVDIETVFKEDQTKLNFKLHSPEKGLMLLPNNYIAMTNFSKDAI